MRVPHSNEFRDFLIGLLCKERRDRLGFNGVVEVLEHPWLADIEREKLEARMLDPPEVNSFTRVFDPTKTQPLFELKRLPKNFQEKQITSEQLEIVEA